MATSVLCLAAISCLDAPPHLPPPLSEDALSYLSPDTLRSRTLAPGAWYHYVWSPVGPWAVHLVEADLTRCELGLDVVTSTGPARVDQMALPDGSLVAVNGDFFTPEGSPLGPELDDGVLRTARGRPALSWEANHGPWIGTARLDGDSVLRVGRGISLARPPRDVEVVGGFPELLDGGRRVGDLRVTESPGFAARRHPRTAVGYAGRGERFWLLVVDGRQGSYSVGMTLPEVTGLFESLGASEALNLDGGGSSVMVIQRRIVSRPSDEGEGSPVVNALVLRSGECAAGSGWRPR